MKKITLSLIVFLLTSITLSFSSMAAPYWVTTDAGTQKQVFPGNWNVPASLPLNGGLSSISTLFASDNGGNDGGAVYFDITVGAQNIYISQLDINSAETGALTLSVYKLIGTSVGNETNAGLWGTPITGTGVGLGNDIASNVTLSEPLTLNANTTYGIAIVLDGAHGHDYTNGTGTNQIYSNSDLTISCGQATNTPFTGSAFSPRVWNGTIYYTTVKPVPFSNWAVVVAMLLIAGSVVIKYRRKRLA